MTLSKAIAELEALGSPRAIAWRILDDGCELTCVHDHAAKTCPLAQWFGKKTHLSIHVECAHAEIRFLDVVISKRFLRQHTRNFLRQFDRLCGTGPYGPDQFTGPSEPRASAPSAPLVATSYRVERAEAVAV